METIELWPFSQGEIDERPDGFIDAVFAVGPDLRHESQVSRSEYAGRIVRGGFPEAVARASPKRRQRFHDSSPTQVLVDFASSSDLDERVVSALHDVAMTGRVRRLRYEHTEGLSLQQVQRDLRELVSAGVLTSVGRTRARYYIEGVRFPEAALVEARTPATIANPHTD